MGMNLVKKILAANRLLDFTTAVLTAVGVPNLDALLVADSLVRADLWGHQSHGVMRLSWYVERIRAGVMRAVTQSDQIVDGGAVEVVDGHDGVGQVLAAQAAREAILRSKAHGVATCFVQSAASTCPSVVKLPTPFP